MSDDPIDTYGPDPGDGDRSYEWWLDQVQPPDLDGRDPATLTELEKLAYAYPAVAELVRERDALRSAHAGGGRYRTGNRNARNVYRIMDDGTEQHVGCMFAEDDGREVVAALNDVERLRAIEQRARAFLADDRMYGTHNVIQAILGGTSC
jgi:hypothetical protein